MAPNARFWPLADIATTGGWMKRPQFYFMKY